MKRILLVLPFVLAACDSGLTGPSKNLVPTTASLSVSGASPTCTIGGITYPRGFDSNGYNDCARIFNGTYSSWCVAGGQAPGCVKAPYAYDKLVMKWNAAWDACNASPSPETCAGAWTDNEENGKIAGGSGAVWHYKIQWIGGDCGLDGTPLPDGGYCIWTSYEVLMDQGIDPILLAPGHFFYAHAIPNGYGT